MSNEHAFEPTQYHNTLGSHEPVLRVQPGETIVTSTVPKDMLPSNV